MAVYSPLLLGAGRSEQRPAAPTFKNLMQRVGRDIDARERWKSFSENYASGIDGGYHRHRLAVIEALLPDLADKTVLDFGCGEGVLIGMAEQKGAAQIIGLDVAPALLEKAAARYRATYIEGGVECLRDIPRVDYIIAANVLAYLTNDEEAAFYQESRRLLGEGGHLVVTHSNALFDVFTFNAYTVSFYREQFGVDVSGLLTQPEKPSRITFNVRENPLSYPEKLRAHGFALERMEFMNRHHAPPLLTSDDPDDMKRERPDTLNTPPAERWKQMFQCSMFGVLAKAS